MKKDIKKVLDNANYEYRRVYGKDLVKVVLYGSYSRNTQNDESDIDIAGIVKGNKEDIQNKINDVRKEIYKFDLNNDTLTSAIAIQYNEFEKYKNIMPYYKNIEEEGILVGW